MSYREPKNTEVESPLFKAIWKAIKTWDINVPEEYKGYCGATGNHVMAIVDSIMSSDEIESKINIAVGMASMCWEMPEKAGVFDTNEGVKVVKTFREMLQYKKESSNGKGEISESLC